MKSLIVAAAVLFAGSAFAQDAAKTTEAAKTAVPEKATEAKAHVEQKAGEAKADVQKNTTDTVKAMTGKHENAKEAMKEAATSDASKVEVKKVEEKAAPTKQTAATRAVEGKKAMKHAAAKTAEVKKEAEKK